MMTEALKHVEKEHTFEDILSPLPDGTAGPYLRYEPIYDRIRKARTEDDHRLSRGVWQIDLKRAEHNVVERLCIDTLVTTSKDLQLFAWLVEARLSLYGFSGIKESFSLLEGFLKRYWDVLHPQDIEHRLSLFEWMDNTFKTKLHLLPLTKVQGEATSYAYHDYLASKALEKALKQQPTEASKLVERARKKGEITVDVFNRYYAQTSKNYLKETTRGLKDFDKEIKNLKVFLDGKLGKNAPSFHQTLSTLSEMVRLTFDPKAEQEEAEIVAVETTKEIPVVPCDQNVERSSVIMNVKDVNLTRSEAYEHLRTLASTFERIEPHSPTANILKKIAGWETMQLTDILSAFTQGGDAFSVFMRLIAK